MAPAPPAEPPHLGLLLAAARQRLLRRELAQSTQSKSAPCKAAPPQLRAVLKPRAEPDQTESLEGVTPVSLSSSE